VTPDQWREMLAPTVPRVSSFPSEGAKRDAWERLHVRIMALLEDPLLWRPGRRPGCWWLYDRHRDPPPPYRQALVLDRMGELTNTERRALRRRGEVI